MNEPWHGSINGYTRHKCRCDECRAAWRTYQRKARARRRGKEPPVHGIASAYREYRCGCEACLAAAAADRRQYG